MNCLETKRLMIKHSCSIIVIKWRCLINIEPLKMFLCKSSSSDTEKKHVVKVFVVVRSQCKFKYWHVFWIKPLQWTSMDVSSVLQKPEAFKYDIICSCQTNLVLLNCKFLGDISVIYFSVLWSEMRVLCIVKLQVGWKSFLK